MVKALSERKEAVAAYPTPCRLKPGQPVGCRWRPDRTAGIRTDVGLSPVSPLAAAGVLIEPPVSVPIAP